MAKHQTGPVPGKHSGYLSVLLYVVGGAAVVAGFPLDGLFGAVASLGGVVCIWVGWFRVVRQSRRDAADRAAVRAWAAESDRGAR